MSLGNSLESDFNLAGIRGPGSGASEGRNSEKRKVLTGKERASESDFETELTVPGGDEVREIVGGGVTVGSPLTGRKDTTAGKKRKEAVAATVEFREETAPGAFPERLRP